MVVKKRKTEPATVAATVTVEGERKAAYITGVDVPRHVAVGDQLPVDVATDLAVPPAVVDVDRADHVPLRRREEEKMTVEKNKHIASATRLCVCRFMISMSTMYSDERDSGRDMRGEGDMDRESYTSYRQDATQKKKGDNNVYIRSSV